MPPHTEDHPTTCQNPHRHKQIHPHCNTPLCGCASQGGSDRLLNILPRTELLRASRHSPQPFLKLQTNLFATEMLLHVPASPLTHRSGRFSECEDTSEGPS